MMAVMESLSTIYLFHLLCLPDGQPEALMLGEGLNALFAIMKRDLMRELTVSKAQQIKELAKKTKFALLI